MALQTLTHATQVVCLYIGLSFWVYPWISAYLQPMVELSTPVSSYQRLREGLYLFHDMQTSPFDGGVFHQSPLLLSIFSSVPESGHALLNIGANAIAALSLGVFAQNFVKNSYSVPIVVLIFLLNPFSLASSIAMSTNVLTNALICCSLGAAGKKKSSLSVSFLALATALGWYPLYLLPSVIGINCVCNEGTQASPKTQGTPSSQKVSIKRLISVFVVAFAAFLGLAYLPLSSWQFLTNQFGTLLLLKDLTQPNIGLWWYFFIEMFEFFRPFFLGAFQLFILAFPIPLMIRFPKQPLFALSTMVGLMAIFKPYPEASDIGLFLTLAIINKPVFELMEYTFFEALGLIYVSVLGPVFYYLWIFVGSGNANFYYAITLVYAVTSILILADSTWAAIRLDYDGGKSTKLTQI